MQIKSATIVDGRLSLETPLYEAQRFVYGFSEGEYEITRKKKKRSLDANGYFWTLCDKIAEAVGRNKTDIYKDAIREIGGNSDTVCVLEKASEKLIEGWEHNGLGWLAETFPSKISGCVNVTLYYGSSVYDTKQMSRLIDNIVQDAKALGIETLPAHELEMMMNAWQ